MRYGRTVAFFTCAALGMNASNLIQCCLNGRF
ncbi:MAG: DUF2492 family protein [Deltaproteobacteria bacterium]|nr:DUF2492 family protein [Deltaproteobacteria bacterium]